METCQSKKELSLADDDFERAAETARTNLGEPHSEKCNALRLIRSDTSEEAKGTLSVICEQTFNRRS